MTHRIVGTLIMTSLVVLTACGGSSIAPTATASLPGTWSGPTGDNFFGTGTMTVTFAQSGSVVSGTWSTTFANASYNNAGTVSGSITGQSIDATFEPSVPAVPTVPTTCRFRVTATLSASEVKGSYATLSCNQFVKGSLDLTPATGTVAPPITTEVFSDTLTLGGTSTYSLSVTQSGTMTVTLVSVTGAGVPATVMLNMSVGTWDGASCTPTTSTNLHAGGAVSNTYAPGTYCVVVADIGNLAHPATFTVSIAHP